MNNTTRRGKLVEDTGVDPVWPHLSGAEEFIRLCPLPKAPPKLVIVWLFRNFRLWELNLRRRGLGEYWAVPIKPSKTPYPILSFAQPRCVSSSSLGMSQFDYDNSGTMPPRYLLHHSTCPRPYGDIPE